MRSRKMELNKSIHETIVLSGRLGGGSRRTKVAEAKGARESRMARVEVKGERIIV